MNRWLSRSSISMGCWGKRSSCNSSWM